MIEDTKAASSQAQHDEQTPLLIDDRAATEATVAESILGRRDEGHSVASSDTAIPEDDRPLPVKQILLLCFVRVTEPIAFFSIFPFINQMCERTGNLRPEQTGFYCGLIESLFSLTQMIVIVGWGRLSDKYGRKPILIISSFGLSIFVAAFGFAQTIWQMILLRCLAGVFSATVITIRTMIGEHTTQKTQATAYSWFAFSGNIGIFIGPLIGGVLADPATQYGGRFAQINFLRQFPYAFATIATGGIAFIAGLITIFTVEETLEKSVKSNVEGDTPAKVWNTSDLLREPGVPTVLWLQAIISILAFAYTAVLPVFWYEPVRLGGFGFSSLYISIFMAITGAAQAIWVLLVFPPLHSRIGTKGVMRWCAGAYPIFFLLNPLMGILLRYGDNSAKTAFWILAPILQAVGVGISMCFTSIQLAVNDINPDPRTLGTINALAYSISSGVRAITPAAFTSLYAVGVQKQILKGYLGWIVMAGIAVIFTISARWLPKKADGLKKPK